MFSVLNGFAYLGVGYVWALLKRVAGQCQCLSLECGANCFGECAVGFSGVLFAMIMLDVKSSPQPTRKSVPGHSGFQMEIDTRHQRHEKFSPDGGGLRTNSTCLLRPFLDGDHRGFVVDCVCLLQCVWFLSSAVVDVSEGASHILVEVLDELVARR